MRRLPPLHRLSYLPTQFPCPTSSFGSLAPNATIASSFPTSSRTFHNTTHKSLFGLGKRPSVDDKEAEEKKRQELFEQREEDREAALARAAASTAGIVARKRPLSRLVLPPDISYAPTPDQAAQTAYEPATDAAGLEEVGSLSDWWDQDGHWGKESEFRSFAVKEKVIDDALLEVMLRQAVVEVLAWKGRNGNKELAKGWGLVHRRAVYRTLGVEMDVKDGGEVVLRGLVSPIITMLEETNTKGRSEPVPWPLMDSDQAREWIAKWDPSWKTLSLGDLSLKFAVRKRLYQLTGHLVPDAKLAGMHTVGHLLHFVCTPPKPMNLVDEIESSGKLENLPNVKVYGRRVTPIDKEMFVGRWKVIESELKKRGLPVTGHSQYGRTREKAWIMGKP